MKRIKIKKRIYKPKFWQWLLFWTLYQEFTIFIPETWQEVEPSNFLMLFAATFKIDLYERQYECVKAILPSEIQDEAHLLSSSSLVRIAMFMRFCCEPRKTDENGFVFEPDKMLNELNSYDFVITRTNLVVQSTDIYKLPGKDLENITCEAFANAVDAYKKVQAGNKHAGFEIIQALLTPFISITELKLNTQYPRGELIVRYFNHSLEVINKTVKELSPTFFGDNSQSDESETKGIDFGWNGVFLRIAKDGVFGTYEQVLKSKFHEVLIYSIQKHEDALKMKENLKPKNDEI